MPEEQMKIGRLAMRQEGGNWVAYWADNETLEDAVFLGSIKLNLITGNPDMRDRFLQLMRDAMTVLIKDIIGETPEWGGVTPALKHEKSGHA